VQLNVRTDEGGGELGVCGCTGAGAPDLGGYVVEFLAVLVVEVAQSANSARRYVVSSC